MKKILIPILAFCFCFADENLSENLPRETMQNTQILYSQDVSKISQNPSQNLTQNSSLNLPQSTPKKANIDMSFKSLFLNAHIVVKFVIGLLIAFSVLTWTVFLAKFIQFGLAFKVVKNDIKKCENFAQISDFAKLGQKSFASKLASQIQDELAKSKSVSEALKMRVKERLSQKTMSFINSLRSHVGVLASIGSSAPFVGLFGTVWGIMNSFIGIANEGNASLGVVAPGIAEALFATALGLVAAIPAVLIYNYFVRLSLNFNSKLDELCTKIYLIFDRENEK